MKEVYVYKNFVSGDAYGNEIIEVYENEMDAKDRLKSDVCKYMGKTWDELMKEYKYYNDEWFEYGDVEVIYWAVSCQQVHRDKKQKAKDYLESLIGLPDGNGGSILADDIFNAIKMLERGS